MNQTIAEALENAGTTVLSRPGSELRTVESHILTVDEVREIEEETHRIGPRVEGEYRAYAGPYTDLEDPRNAWTSAQDAGEVSRTRELVEEEEGGDNGGDETESARDRRAARRRSRTGAAGEGETSEA